MSAATAFGSVALVTPAVLEAHEFIRRRVGSGGAAFDATAGRGQDTVFLARLLGPEGQVHACDVQAAALEATLRRWEAERGPKARLHLHWAGHQEMAPILRTAGILPLQAVMFNLGYLPAGDRTLITRPTTTVAALESLVPLLAPGGVLTVVGYPGHAGGAEELEAVADWASRLPRARARACRWQSINAAGRGPQLIAVEIVSAPGSPAD